MKLIKIALVFMFLFIISSSFFLIVLLWKFSPQLPSYEKIINYQPNLSSRIYSSDGLLLKSFYLEERIFIPVERIPNQVKKAFISAEDKNFYNHFGVDFFAIFYWMIVIWCFR